MTFNPMDMPPGTGPSLQNQPGKPWYSNKVMWVLVSLVLLGVVIFAY